MRSCSASALTKRVCVERGEVSFALGCMCTIEGFTEKPELNGQAAMVLGPVEDGRYPVNTMGSGIRIRVTPDNLRAAAHLEPRLNPSRITPKSELMATDRLPKWREGDEKEGEEEEGEEEA